jgi:hypothetical protein
MKNATSVFAAAVLLSSIARGQDLFDRLRADKDEKQPAVQVQQERSGVSARVAPDYDYQGLAKDRGSSAVGSRVSFDYDFSCGRFDVRSSLKNLLSQEFRDEFVQDLLNAGEGYLASNALNLLCQASPTLCNVFKHHRANANALLAINYDKCQAMEQALQADTQRARARILKDCMERMLRENPEISLDEAQRKCLRSEEIRNLKGEFVKELNLVEDLSKFFELDPDASKDVSSILGETRLTSQGKEQTRVGSLGGYYATRKSGYILAWSVAFSRKASSAGLSQDEFGALAPRAAQVTDEDVRTLNLIPDWKRDLLVRVLAGAFALYDATIRARQIEELIAQVQAAGASELVKAELEARRKRVREELNSLREEYEGMGVMHRAILSARVESEAEVARVIQGKVSLLSQSLENESVYDRFGSGWGKLKKPEAPGAKSALGPGSKCCGQPDGFRGGVYGQGR